MFFYNEHDLMTSRADGISALLDVSQDAQVWLCVCGNYPRSDKMCMFVLYRDCRSTPDNHHRREMPSDQEIAFQAHSFLLFQYHNVIFSILAIVKV